MLGNTAGVELQVQNVTSADSEKPDVDDAGKSPTNTANASGFCHLFDRIWCSFEKLKAKQFESANVDRSRLEQYLSDEQFMEKFKMTKSDFAAKPGWKQKSMKKAVGLFWICVVLCSPFTRIYSPSLSILLPLQYIIRLLDNG